MPPKNLIQLQEAVHSFAYRCTDHRVHSKDMLFHGIDEIEWFSEPDLLFTDIATVADRGYLNDHARGQLADRFGVPKAWSFSDKCPPVLRKEIYDWKFRNAPQEDLLIRAKTDIDVETVRGILSSSYRPYDNHELVDAVVEAFNTKGIDPEQVRVIRPVIGDDLKAHLLIPGIRFDQWNNGGPDASDGGGSGGIQPAVYIGNSEVGRAKSRVTGATYRDFCENGLIYGWNSNTEFAFVHRGERHISLLINEAIASAMYLSEQGAEAYLDKMATKVEETRIDTILDTWSTKYGITVESKDAWDEMVTTDARRGSISEFDVINNLTYVAKQAADEDERETLERMAGDMVFAELQPRRIQR
jgi:hypothetical protein